MVLLTTISVYFGIAVERLPGSNLFYILSSHFQWTCDYATAILGILEESYIYQCGESNSLSPVGKLAPFDTNTSPRIQFVGELLIPFYFQDMVAAFLLPYITIGKPLAC